MEPGGVKDSGDGHLFPWWPHWETWEKAPMPGGLGVKKGSGTVSLHIGATLGDLGRKGPSTGNFER